MMNRIAVIALALILESGAHSAAARKYDGPKPPKPDLPYLVHADRLVATEQSESRQETRKNETAFVIPGAASPARTPMAEPIFIFESKDIKPETLELYRLDVAGGNREVVMGGKKRRNEAKRIRIAISAAGDRLYTIETVDSLENGEYSLSPNDSNRVFCFAVY